MRLLPFNVAIFNAVVASFNSFGDAKEYAIAQSVKYNDGWVELRDPHKGGAIIVAYQNAKVVYGND